MSPRVERLILGCLLLAAFVVRAWQPDHMSVEHFDEGVYASGYFAEHLGSVYPDWFLYAPPFLAGLFKLVLWSTGGAPDSVMWVNVVLGTALVGGVWWATRQLSTPSMTDAGRPDELADLPRQVSRSAALAAATITAFSDMMIQYSRAALTDVPVCLWMSLAVGAGARGLMGRGMGWLVASGILTGIAWWTKYNGWLPLAILGAGLFAWLVAGWIRPRDDQSLGDSAEPEAISHSPGVIPDGSRCFWRSAIGWGLIAAIAVVVWLPFLWELQSVGGYGVVARNHSGYLVGWSGWGSSLVRQLSVDRYYSRAFTAAGAYLACLLAGAVFTWNRQQDPNARLVSWLGYFLGLLSLPVVLLGGLLPLLLFLMLAAAVLSRSRFGFTPIARVFMGTWIIFAWVAGLLVVTPLYRPYPRLILPLLTGSIIGGAMAIAWGIGGVVDRLAKRSLDAPAPTSSLTERESARRTQTFAIRTVIVLALIFLTGSSSAWQDRRGLEVAANSLLSRIQEDLADQPSAEDSPVRFIIYVLAEPGLYYHLAAREDRPEPFITQPAANLGMLAPGRADPAIPTYLVTGPHALDEADSLRSGDYPISSLAVIGYQPSDLVLLDDNPPRELPQKRRESLQLWKINSR